MKIRLVGDLMPIEIPSKLHGEVVTAKIEEGNQAAYFTYDNRNYVVWTENYEVIDDEKLSGLREDLPEVLPINKKNVRLMIWRLSQNETSSEDKGKIMNRLFEVVNLLIPE